MSEAVFVVGGPGEMEINANRIAEIIRIACPASPEEAAAAANLIVDYLIEAMQAKRQQ